MDSNNLTLEDLGRKGYKMYQLKDGFRFGTDTVLLAWFTASFVKGAASAKMLELGANCGAATLLISARKESVSIDALEIDADACEVLRKNIEINVLNESVEAYEGDVRELPQNVRQKQYDLVFMNPPFFKETTGPSSAKVGRCELNGCLEDFIKAGATRLIPSSGIMTVVMTASRADEVMKLMSDNGVKSFRFMSVHPAHDKKAEMVLIAGKKTNADTQLEIMAPLILNDKDRMKDIYDKEHTDCFI
ncbi:MAG: methyltransferase [Saccharofermentans sp.]|nr:methyltransferase [Saccharofermentans sp.]